MRGTFRAILIIAAAATVLGGVPTAHAATVLNPAGLISRVYVNGQSSTATGYALDDRYPSALPSAFGVTTSGPGWSSGAQYSLTDGLFNVTFAQSRHGVVTSYASSQSYLFFSVTQDVDYALTGSYAVHDSPAAVSGDLVLAAQLSEYGGDNLFYSYQYSKNTANEVFTVGGSGGDDTNKGGNTGLTGRLKAGKAYMFYVGAYTEAYPDTDGGATADGSVSLSFTPVPTSPAATPLPAAAWGGLALFGLVGGKGLLARRRRWAAA